jgi:hypothetical protein
MCLGKWVSRCAQSIVLIQGNKEEGSGGGMLQSVVGRPSGTRGAAIHGLKRIISRVFCGESLDTEES